MTRDEIRRHISIDPNVCFGKPCVRGTRVWVSMILDFLSNGVGVPEILGEYPQLREEDILACLAYGAEMARGSDIEVPGEAAGEAQA